MVHNLREDEARRPRLAASADGEAATLSIARGIKLDGEISACHRLIVAGEARAKLHGVSALEIPGGGRFVGEAEVQHAEIGGDYEGELRVRGRLIVRAGARLRGRFFYDHLEIERGARVDGEIGPAAALKPAG